MQLIVAEKPSVARDLARVLGVRPSGQHAFEGERWVITWCVGHLVELEEPAAYDARWKAWRLDSLPILPAEFRLRAASHAAPQLRAVTRLLRERRFTGVVNACDAGREGELIFRYVQRFAGGSPPVRRLWISSLTEEAIRKGFAALRPAGDFDALGDAARCRSEADWLVGMNATRAITARARDAGDGSLYSVGRVQTPTLAMLVAREHEITAFVPSPYWEVRADLVTADGHRFAANWRYGGAARLARADLAQAVAARAQAHGGAGAAHGPRVERLRARTVKEPPPQLFDLTSLQRTANKRFGFSAAHTLEVAQALYERAKLLTYPRTDSRHLSSDVARELPELFRALSGAPDYAAFADELLACPPRPGRRVVDDGKVSDHHAIIPTAKVSAAAVAALGRDERRLFDLVARRFLGVFFADAEFAVTEAWIAVGEAAAEKRRVAVLHAAAAPGAELGESASSSASGSASGRAAPAASPVDVLPPPPDVFVARGRVRVVDGWQAVAGIEPRDLGRQERRGRDDDAIEDGDGGRGLLPALVEGQRLSGTFGAVAKTTTPPPRYTEATLLGAMEAAGKSMDDEELRQAMKDCGLGPCHARRRDRDAAAAGVSGADRAAPPAHRDGPWAHRGAAGGEPRVP
ncbi:MAG: hypothetical protein IPI49_30000 [Myxococcales bacterium]|nr:hypothetical protein [Myxococcales bacterium]